MNDPTDDDDRRMLGPRPAVDAEGRELEERARTLLFGDAATPTRAARIAAALVVGGAYFLVLAALWSYLNGAAGRRVLVPLLALLALALIPAALSVQEGLATWLDRRTT